MLFLSVFSINVSAFTFSGEWRFSITLGLSPEGHRYDQVVCGKRCCDRQTKCKFLFISKYLCQEKCNRINWCSAVWDTLLTLARVSSSWLVVFKSILMVEKFLLLLAFIVRWWWLLFCSPKHLDYWWFHSTTDSKYWNDSAYICLLNWCLQELLMSFLEIHETGHSVTFCFLKKKTFF